MYGNILWDDLITENNEARPKFKEPEAFCNSALCFKNREDSSHGVRKELGKHESFCRDCGSAVYWMRPKLNHARNNNVVSKKRSRYSKADAY